MRKKYYRTDYLFARGSFIVGMGSLLGVFSPYYTFNYSDSNEEADAQALESDFGVISMDIQNVFSK